MCTEIVVTKTAFCNVRNFTQTVRISLVYFMYEKSVRTERWKRFSPYVEIIEKLEQ